MPKRRSKRATAQCRGIRDAFRRAAARGIFTKDDARSWRPRLGSAPRTMDYRWHPGPYGISMTAILVMAELYLHIQSRA